MVLAQLNFVVINSFAQVFGVCLIIFVVIQVLQTSHSNGKDLSCRLEHRNVLVLQLLKFVFKFLFS